ncbi:MAG: hypothetical protein NZM00_08825, partial [Anaerolinea sp.]|nr:hypothetical protein [Anaerolinea sp.]
TPTALPPQLTGSGVCLEPQNILQFTITNTGGSTSGVIGYVVFTPSGQQLTGDVQPIPPGGSQTLDFGGQPAGTYTFFTLDSIVNVVVVCAEQPGATPTPPPAPTSTPVPTEPVIICYAGEWIELPANPGSTGPGFPLINMDTADTCVYEDVPAPPWTPIQPGGAVCPDWLVYHTNVTGDWELFRLGEIPGEPDAEVNLSQGVGDRVYDVSPARSPDSQWIAFTSNRDDNWELYIGRTNGSEQRRITFNTGVDVGPAWSPNGQFIAFQSNRDGDFDLYLLDVITGGLQQLTDVPGSDINAAWSPDGTKIAFQSDREGFWQIYELNLLTGIETRLSDGSGDDHNPQYSNDGERILFRSYRLGANSVVFYMDADGQNIVQVSDEGGNALNAIWSGDDRLIAYQSNLDGDYDIYIYQVESDDQPAQTRLLTDNTISDVAPTWLCSSPTIVWTSNVGETPDTLSDNELYSTNALPIDADPIDVKAEAAQLTDVDAEDQYPQNTPLEEDASREGQLPGRARNR